MGKNIMTFAEILSEAREKKGMNKAQAASYFGWTPMYYGRYERGQLLPTKYNYDKFASFIGIEVESLIEIIRNNG